MQGLIFVRGHAEDVDKDLCSTDAYNVEMQKRMHSNICYIHDAGPNYTHILPALIVGSFPQTRDDLDNLANEVGGPFPL
jgi:hypothetical protein